MMRCVIAGGGTGGHIYPAVALAERLGDSGPVAMLARPSSMEERVFRGHGLDVRLVESAPLLYTPRAVWKLADSTRRGVQSARQVLADVHADAFIGTGGYVSVPGILAAHELGIPIYLLEQNTIMGRANRLFSHHARHVFLGFPVEGLSGPRYPLTGNPLRRAVYEELVHRREDPANATELLFLGGSGGATFINDLSLRTIRALNHLGRSAAVTVVTGTDEYARVRDELDRLGPGTVRATIVPYEEHMECLYGNSRAAVTRGGALALTELAVGGIYALAVPYPFAVGQHQARNAEYVQSLGLGESFEQDSFDFDRFLTRLLRALDSDLTAALEYEATVFGQDAGDRITRTILEECSHG